MTEKLIEVSCVSVLLTPDVELRSAAHPSFQMNSLWSPLDLLLPLNLLRAIPVHPCFSKFPSQGAGAGFPVLPYEKTSGIHLQMVHPSQKLYIQRSGTILLIGNKKAFITHHVLLLTCIFASRITKVSLFAVLEISKLIVLTTSINLNNCSPTFIDVQLEPVLVTGSRHIAVNTSRKCLPSRCLQSSVAESGVGKLGVFLT